MQKNNSKSVILGLNGWSERGHDASACLIINNKIVAFAEEERFTRKRYSYDSMPLLSTAYCLKQAKIDPEDLTKIVFGWDMPKVYKIRGRAFPYTKAQIAELIFPKNLYTHKKLAEIEFLNHHVAHAASAYRISGFDEASVLILDGQGEDSSGTLAFGNKGNIKVIEKIQTSYSLGYMMEAACLFLGLRTSDAGKLMGLAGHGKKANVFDNLKLDENSYSFANFKNDKALIGHELDEQKKVIEQWLNYFQKKYPLTLAKQRTYNTESCSLETKIIFTQKHKNFAYSVQKTLEEIVVHLTKVVTRKTGCRNLVIAGGVGLNCTTNGRLLSENLIDNLFVQPAANDAGVSMGAALESAYQAHKYKFGEMQHSYLGPSFSDNQVEHILKRLKIPYSKQKNIAKKAAQSIADGNVVAWFQGKMEGGPRALGNRSILANPKMNEMHEIVNEIKFRENWRPLSPSILEDKVAQYFETGEKSPFMLQTHKVRKAKSKEIPAVIHSDLTARYQSVSRKANSKFYSLLEEFYYLTGTPIVMNTSLNTHGEPLVCTPEHALKTFYATGIDCMAIENYWITK